MKKGYIIFMPKYAKIDEPIKIIGTFIEAEKNSIFCLYDIEKGVFYNKSCIISTNFE